MAEMRGRQLGVPSPAILPMNRYHHRVAANHSSYIPHIYDRYRPIPPRQIYTVLLSIAKKRAGIGSRFRMWHRHFHSPWAEFAKKVLGIDVSIDMVECAKRKTKEENVSYLVGRGSSTGLADQNVDIVTCSSSIHWMEPASTLQEIDRILKPDGLFAVYGPKIHLSLHGRKVGAAFNKFLAFAKEMDLAEPDEAKPARWKWAEIIEYAKKQDSLRYVDELSFCSIVEWDAHHFFQWLSTISYVNRLMKVDDSSLKKLKFIINNSFADNKQMLLFFLPPYPLY